MQPRLKLDIGWHDLLSALVPVGRESAEIEDAVAAHAPADTFPVVGLSVRSLFQALLMELPDNEPVAMSAVTVEDMATLVRHSGRLVRPIDISMDTLLPTPDDADAACGGDACMLVIAHLYGSRGSVKDTAARCAAPGRLIVEDCAQAFDGRLFLSARADVALYSFGPIKTATALGGAIGLFRDKVLSDRVRARMADWPRHGDRWFLRRILKFGLLKLASTPLLYGSVLAGLGWLYGDSERVVGTLARGFAGRPIADAVRHRPPPRLLRLLDRRLRSWTPAEDATGELFTRLAGRFEIPGYAARPSHWWLAPVLATNPDRLVAALRRRGYDATRGTTSMRALPVDEGDPPANAARLIASVVYLPKPANAAAAAKLAQVVSRR